MKFYIGLKHAILNGRLGGNYSDTYLTLEYIQKKNRSSVLGSRRIVPKWVSEDGVNTLKVGPKMDKIPIRKQKHLDFANEAKRLGVMALKGPFIAGRTMLLEDHSFYEVMELSVFEAYQDRMREAYNKMVEVFGDKVGTPAAIKFGLEAIGDVHGKLFYEGFALPNRLKENATVSMQLKQEEKKWNDKVSRVVAEMSDWEFMIRHIGRQNQYFCTNDQGGDKKDSSILGPKNCDTLREKFGVRVVSPKDLLGILDSM